VDTLSFPEPQTQNYLNVMVLYPHRMIYCKIQIGITLLSSLF